MSSNSPQQRLTELRGQLVEATVDTLWGQWRAIGGSAVGSRIATAIVDPEALALASLFFQDDEPRLRDVLYAWIERNAPLLSVRRLRTLAIAHPPAVTDRLKDLAPIAAKLAKHPRWAALSDSRVEADLSIERFETPRATEPRLDRPPALMLRIRTALGVGVKADVLTYLLGQVRRNEPDLTTVRAIADGTGYTLVATRRALDDLSAAKLIIAKADRPISFKAPKDGWQDLLQIEKESFPRWWPWHRVFAFDTAFIDWADHALRRQVSDTVFRIRTRELFDQHPVAQRIVRDHWLGPGSMPPQDMTPEAVANLADWQRRAE